VPRPWKPLGPTTDEEVLFLSPLDPVVGGSTPALSPTRACEESSDARPAA
jgi:hypothetical protein